MADRKYPLVSVVIVQYKDDPYLTGLLSSIGKLDYPKSALEIIIVTILSSPKKIRLGKIPVTQIHISHQAGYAEAANLGITRSRGTYIFSPNPDTIVEKTAVTKMVAYIQKHKDVGIVGPQVFLMTDPTKISIHDLPCKHFDERSGKITVVTEDELAAVDKSQPFYWLCGNGIVLRKSIWREAKGYDEHFFLYWEDADLGMRVRRLGYQSVLIADAKLFHKGSASMDNTADQIYYAVRNGRYFLNKYSQLPGRLLLHVTSILLIISKSFQIILGMPEKKLSQAFRNGITDFYRGKRGIREKEKLD